jgi:hypothetical protein
VSWDKNTEFNNIEMTGKEELYDHFALTAKVQSVAEERKMILRALFKVGNVLRLCG